MMIKSLDSMMCSSSNEIRSAMGEMMANDRIPKIISNHWVLGELFLFMGAVYRLKMGVWILTWIHSMIISIFATFGLEKKNEKLTCVQLLISLVVSIPLKKMLVKMGSSSPGFGVNMKKYLSCQHLVYD